MDRLAELTVAYLRAQIAAGVDVVQLFDSWVGALSPADYAQFVQPYMRRIFTSLRLRRRADDPLRHQQRRRCSSAMATDGATVIGARLARAARRGVGAHWPRSRRAGQPRPGGAVRAARRARGASARRAPACRRSAGPHLQPGSRAPARDAARQRHPAGRVRARRERRDCAERRAMSAASAYDHHGHRTDGHAADRLRHAPRRPTRSSRTSVISAAAVRRPPRRWPTCVVATS